MKGSSQESQLLSWKVHHRNHSCYHHRNHNCYHHSNHNCYHRNHSYHHRNHNCYPERLKSSFNYLIMMISSMHQPIRVICIKINFVYYWNSYNNTAYWSTIGSIYFSIKIVSPVRIFGNLGCFSTLITVPTCKVISVHMSFEHCKGLVPGLYVDILKVFCTAGSQCNSLFLTTADCCSKEKVFSPVFWQIFQLFEHFKPNFGIILVPP